MTTEGFNQLIAEATPDIRELIIETKHLLEEVYPEYVEVPWVKQKTIGYGIGEKKMSEHFSWIGIYSKHIVLGFNYGTELPDPDNILEGTGKLFRHYKIRSVNDILNPALNTVLASAVQDIKQRNNR